MKLLSKTHGLRAMRAITAATGTLEKEGLDRETVQRVAGVVAGLSATGLCKLVYNAWTKMYIFAMYTKAGRQPLGFIQVARGALGVKGCAAIRNMGNEILRGGR